MRKLVVHAVLLAAMLAVDSGAAAPSIIHGDSTVSFAGKFSGNDCGGNGGFMSCRATIKGMSQGTHGSAPAYKAGANGDVEFGSFTSFSGYEFAVSFDSVTNELSFTYAPDPGDPDIHFSAIKQANGFAYFSDVLNSITSYSADLDMYFGGKNADDFSYITFFDR